MRVRGHPECFDIKYSGTALFASTLKRRIRNEVWTRVIKHWFNYKRLRCYFTALLQYYFRQIIFGCERLILSLFRFAHFKLLNMDLYISMQQENQWKLEIISKAQSFSKFYKSYIWLWRQSCYPYKSSQNWSVKVVLNRVGISFHYRHVTNWPTREWDRESLTLQTPLG